jgi:hypothetical protein
MPWVSSAHPDSVLLSFTFFKHISSQKRSFFSGKLKSKRAGSSSPEQLSNKKLSGSFVSGFIDAEGSFIVSIYKRAKVKFSLFYLSLSLSE